MHNQTEWKAFELGLSEHSSRALYTENKELVLHACKKIGERIYHYTQEQRTQLWAILEVES